MADFVDLHLHTNHSDGADAPADVVRRAAELGIKALAITDHDAVSAIPEARAACAAHGIGFLPGTEISALYNHIEVHVAGLGIDPANTVLCEGLAGQREARWTRAKRIVAKLQDCGLAIDFHQVAGPAGAGGIGRMHIAAALHEMGVVRTVQQAFDRYLNPHRPAHVPKTMTPVEEAIGWIHAAGGLAFLAHPAIGANTWRRLDALLAYPFDGLEAYHIRHNATQQARLCQMAHARGLLVSGGSDCHGDIKREGPEMGKVRVPVACYAQIVERLAQRDGKPGTSMHQPE